MTDTDLNGQTNAVGEKGRRQENESALTSRPDSNRASCMEPSSLPRQMIPSGASDRARTNQLPLNDERGSES